MLNTDENKQDKIDWKTPEPKVLTKEELSEIMIANARTDGCSLCGCSCGMFCWIRYIG